MGVTPPLRPASLTLRLNLLLTLVGGSLDGYTFLTRDGVFSTAQTGNVAILGVSIARGAWHEAVRHLVPIGAFVVGVLVAGVLIRPSVAAAVRRPARVVLVVELVALVVVGFLPSSVPNEIVTVIIAAVAGMQVTVFRTVHDWQYNSMFTTSNLRTFALALFGAVVDRDRRKLHQAGVFAAIISTFAAGAVIGGLGARGLHEHGVWISAGLLAAALVVFFTGPEDGRTGTVPRSVGG